MRVNPPPLPAHLAPVQVLGQLGVLPGHVVGYVVHEPLEALAAQTLLHGQLLADVAHVQVPETGETRKMRMEHHGNEIQ